MQEGGLTDEVDGISFIISSLNQEGVMGVVVPHGVLFRGGQEGEIRKGILEDDLIEAVIGLPWIRRLRALRVAKNGQHAASRLHKLLKSLLLFVFNDSF